jgi:outer membrane immunogenic protein
MRRVMLGLLGLVFVSNAFAADYPDYLRGSTYEAPPVRYNWAGVYVGGQFGYVETGAAFDPIQRNVSVDRLLRPTIESDANLAQWPGLTSTDARGSSYGGFIGYNSQWGDAVLGFEMNYSRGSHHTSSIRTVVVDTSTATGIAGSRGQVDYAGDMRITDVLSARLRAGYAWNWLMPYATIGAVVGRADHVRSANVTYTPVGHPEYTDIESKNGQITYGYSAGFGVDVGLMPGVFVRGEYEFVSLNTLNAVTAYINTFRVAAAYKF